MSSQIGSGWGGESGRMEGVDGADPSLEEDSLGGGGEEVVRRVDVPGVDGEFSYSASDSTSSSPPRDLVRYCLGMTFFCLAHARVCFPSSLRAAYAS